MKKLANEKEDDLITIHVMLIKETVS